MSENKNSTGIQYLTFMLDGKLFAFDVLKTREVLSLIPITPIPGTPPHMSGVLNLRGSIVPVIDLRRKFGMPELAVTVNTSIIIVESITADGVVVVGVLVDAVKGVIVFEQNQMEPPPKVGMKLNLDLIQTIGKTEKDFILILNIGKVLSDEDLVMAKDILDSMENK